MYADKQCILSYTLALNLFQIRERVRGISLKDKSSETHDYLGGNLPGYDCTPTNSRKLYLFPKYPVLRDK